MNENRRIALISGCILLALGAGGYFWLSPRQTAPADSAETAAVEPAVSTVAAGEPLPDQYPVPTVDEDEPLPELADSDVPFGSALAALISPEQLAAVLVSEQMIQKLVVTVDNLPRARLSMNARAIKRVPGEFIVRKRDGGITLNPENEARYLPLLTLLGATGAEPLAKLYLRFYPLFNKAYRELGYPDRNFNDRLVQVIDHLLASPAVEGPIALVQPSVLYEFADAGLEGRSAGQKMMIRMGTENQAQAKQLLKDFRAEVTGAAKPE